jgi:hypothetical protein
MAASSDGYLFYRTAAGKDVSTTTSFVATGATGVTLITVTGSTRRLNIQRITLLPTTFAAGNLTFGEVSSGSGVFAVLAQPAAVYTPTGAALQYGGNQAPSIDFGPKGWPLTAGANLFMVRSATGSAAGLIIEAYETVSGPVAMGTTN